MCGIAGAFTAKHDTSALTIIESILNDQRARGPDHLAVSSIAGRNSTAILGHNRLSIVDLSSHANQPMWDGSGRYCITYNGEIYNHVELHRELVLLDHEFHTHSDTEVILNAFKQWGIEALQCFNGPFAFALFDKERDELWLCRDRFGVKPLYYIWQNNELYFASTPTELAKQLKLSPNLDYVARGLKYWVYEDDTDIAPYQQMQQIPAGCYLKVNVVDGQFQPQLIRYYDLVTRVQHRQSELEKLSTADLLQQGLEYLQRAVSMRLRADVPVGVALSGGLDSSSVAALASAQHPEVLGFSFGHPNIRYTEGPLVKQLAQHAKLTVDYIWPTAEEFTTALFKTIKAQGAPFAGISVVAQHLVYQRAREKGIKVLLGGQGGDEVFMGYRKFNWFWLQELLHQKKYSCALQFLYQLMPMFFAELGQFRKYWQQRKRYQANHIDDNILDLPQAQPLLLGYKPGNGIKSRQIQDITQFSLPTLLRYEDRNSLGNSVEGRLPFMDYQVVEYGLALPEVLKLRQGYGKWAVREWMHGKIPESIRVARYKRGFDVSLDELLERGFGKAIRDVLQAQATTIRPYLNSHVDINDIFSDARFKNRPATFAEAVSLMWLGNCT